MVNFFIGFGFVVFFFTFVSLFLNGADGRAWRVWGLVFSTLAFLVSRGRSDFPHWGWPQETEPEDWDNKTPGMIFGRYDGTFANYDLRDELEFRRKLLAEGKEPGPIRSGPAKHDYIKSLGQVNDIARENAEALAKIDVESSQQTKDRLPQLPE